MVSKKKLVDLQESHCYTREKCEQQDRRITG